MCLASFHIYGGQRGEAKVGEEPARSSGASAVQRLVHFAKKGALPRVEVDAGYLITIEETSPGAAFKSCVAHLRDSMVWSSQCWTREGIRNGCLKAQQGACHDPIKRVEIARRCLAGRRRPRKAAIEQIHARLGHRRGHRPPALHPFYQVT